MAVSLHLGGYRSICCPEVDLEKRKPYQDVISLEAKSWSRRTRSRKPLTCLQCCSFLQSEAGVKRGRAMMNPSMISRLHGFTSTRLGTRLALVYSSCWSLGRDTIIWHAFSKMFLTSCCLRSLFGGTDINLVCQRPSGPHIHSLTLMYPLSHYACYNPKVGARPVEDQIPVAGSVNTNTKSVL